MITAPFFLGAATLTENCPPGHTFLSRFTLAPISFFSSSFRQLPVDTKATLERIIRTYDIAINAELRAALVRAASTATDDEAALAAAKATTIDLQCSKGNVEREAQAVEAAIAA